MKRVVVALIFSALMVPVFLGVTTAQVSAAPSIKCGPGKTYGWVSSPVNDLKVGSRYCRTMTHGSISGATAFWFKATNGKWVPTSNNQPVSGGSSAASKAHAKAAKDLATKLGMTLAFTKYSGDGDREGQINERAIVLSGTYYPYSAYSGKGLIEISAGGDQLGAIDYRGPATKMQVRNLLLDVVRHETSHARIELKCGTWKPQIVGSRVEQVTEAYAVTYFGKKHVTYPYTSADLAKAKKIADGICE